MAAERVEAATWLLRREALAAGEDEGGALSSSRRASCNLALEASALLAMAAVLFALPGALAGLSGISASTRRL